MRLARYNTCQFNIDHSIKHHQGGKKNQNCFASETWEGWSWYLALPNDQGLRCEVITWGLTTRAGARILLNVLMKDCTILTCRYMLQIPKEGTQCPGHRELDMRLPGLSNLHFPYSANDVLYIDLSYRGQDPGQSHYQNWADSEAWGPCPDAWWASMDPSL